MMWELMLLILFRQQCFYSLLPLASRLLQKTLDLLVALLSKAVELSGHLV